MDLQNFKDYFNSNYFRIYRSLFPEKRSKKEAEFLASFIPSKDSAVLDFGCAWGRHLKELAKMGYTNLVGVDFSDKLLDLAKKNLENYPIVKFIVADFVSFKSNQKYDFIYHTFQSFGHEDFSYDQSTISKAASLLTSHGKYFLDLRNPIKLYKNEKFDLPGNVQVDSHYDKKSKREKFIYNFDGQHDEIEFNVYSEKELGDMFKKTGLKVIKTYGSFDGKPYVNDSERLILIGKKL